jgi:SAM-dependent methyltransferase
MKEGLVIGMIRNSPKAAIGLKEHVLNATDTDLGFKPNYFENLFQMEADSFWFRCRNRLIIWALKKYFADCKSLLEVGCGTGFVLTAVSEAIPKWELAGSEFFSEGLAYAKTRLPSVDLFQLDARRMPFENRYDVIGAFDVIEHIVEDEDVLRELYRGSRNGIILTVPQHQFLWSTADEYACHKRRYSAAELRQKVEAAGFEVVRMTSFVSLLLPALLLARLKKVPVEQFDPMAEFNKSRRIDKLLESILNFEQGFIRLGWNLPLGGSLLLIARKRSLVVPSES